MYWLLIKNKVWFLFSLLSEELEFGSFIITVLLSNLFYCLWRRGYYFYKRKRRYTEQECILLIKKITIPINFRITNLDSDLYVVDISKERYCGSCELIFKLARDLIYLYALGMREKIRKWDLILNLN